MLSLSTARFGVLDLEGDDASFMDDLVTSVAWLKVATAAGENGLSSKGLVVVSFPTLEGGSDSIETGKALVFW